MSDLLHTPVCELLGCRYPVVLAGMGGVARAELVLAVTRAGGFGFLGMVREPVSLIRSEVAKVRKHTDRPFGVNLIPASTNAELLASQIDTCIELRVPVVGLFWDIDAEVVQRLRSANICVICQVGSIAEARLAQQAGAQAIIIQGSEAGGHVRAKLPLEQLLPNVVSAIDIPVMASGGIADGTGLATVLALGAQAAVMGTALLATHESFAHDYHKRRLVDARSDDTVLTEAFHINWPRGAPVRVLANSVTSDKHGDPFTSETRPIGDEEGRPIYLFSTESPLRSMQGDLEAMALYAGQGVDYVDSIVPAEYRIRTILSEAAGLLSSGVKERASIIRPGSSPCSMQEFETSYLHRASRTQCLEALNILLEAERAGARVAMRTAGEVSESGLKTLIAGIQRDEARWCAVLTRSIRALNGTPSRNTGAFYEKAMAIADVPARLAFLNRGQGWVVRKLQELLPKIGDDGLHADLTQMLRSHQENIEKVDCNLESRNSNASSD